MPNPVEQLYEIAFAGQTTKELAAVARVLQAATQRLEATRNEAERGRVT